MKEFSSEENQAVVTKKKMSSRDKKLIAFIVIGFIVCVVLGVILVNMCTKDPYNSHDYSSLVEFIDIESVKAPLPEDLITDIAVNEEIERRLLAAGIEDLDKEFIEKDTDGECSSEKEYDAYIRKYLVKKNGKDLSISCSHIAWEDFVIHSKIGEPTKLMVDREYNLLYDNYKHRYDFQSGDDPSVSWDKWVSDQFGSDTKEFKNILRQIATTNATTKMTTYAYWDEHKDDLKWSDKKYAAYCEDILSDYDFTKDTIKEATGYTWDEYCKATDMRSLYMAREAGQHLYREAVKKSSK